MLSAIDVAHFLSFVGTPDVNVLLPLKAVKQNITKTTVKIHFNSRYNFLKDIGFSRARSFWMTRFLYCPVGLKNLRNIWIARKRDKL